MSSIIKLSFCKKSTIKPILESARKKTHPRSIDLYDVFCGCFYFWDIFFLHKKNFKKLYLKKILNRFLKSFTAPAFLLHKQKCEECEGRGKS